MESNFFIDAIKKVTFTQAVVSLVIFLCVLFFISLPYSCTFFKFGISNNSANWGEYGSYISGITSVLNLIVFILLTAYVAQLGDSNSKKQIATQGKLIKAQFRQDELNKLSLILNKPFDEMISGKIGDLANSLIVVDMKLLSLTKKNATLFRNILEPDNHQEICKRIRQNAKLIIELDEKNIKLSELTVKENELIAKLIANIFQDKEILISLLQEYVLIELEK